MSNLGILTNIKLGNHFIQRFNERYFGRSHQWNISDCKSYIDKIMTPTQKKLLDKVKDNKKEKGIRVGFGSSNMVVVANNKLITLLNKKKGKVK